MDVFSLGFLQMDGLRRRRRIVREIFSFLLSLRPSVGGGDGFEGRMYSWIERLNRRGTVEEVEEVEEKRIN